MADQQQSGSMIGDIASGLGKVAQYALPAALGAAMGGVGGAAAGLGMGAEGIQEAQQRQQEMQQREQELDLRRQETAMEYQRVGMENQKLQVAMRDDQAQQALFDTLPPDEQKVARANPAAYIEKMQADNEWKVNIKAWKAHPEFAAQFGIAPNMLDALGAMNGKDGMATVDSIIKNRLTGKFANGIRGPFSDDDGKSWYNVAYGAGGEETRMPTGAPASAVNAATKAAGKEPSSAALESLAVKAANDAKATTATGYAGTTFGASDKDRFAAAKSAYIKQLTAAPYNLDPDKAEDLANRYVGPKFGMGDSDKKAAPADKLPTPPKNLWGKTVTVNGKRYKIDTMGKATPLS